MVVIQSLKTVMKRSYKTSAGLVLQQRHPGRGSTIQKNLINAAGKAPCPANNRSGASISPEKIVREQWTIYGEAIHPSIDESNEVRCFRFLYSAVPGTSLAEELNNRRGSAGRLAKLAMFVEGILYGLPYPRW